MLACFAASTAFAVDHAVAIRDNFFSPATLTIAPGDTVTWTQHGNNSHTTTSDTGVWNSGVLAKDATFSFTFPDTGTFPYHCAIHGQSMSGTITVSTNNPGPPRDLYLVNLSGRLWSTNSAGRLVAVARNTRSFVNDCAADESQRAADLVLVYDVQVDAIEVVNRHDGSTVCTLARFVGGVTLAGSNGAVKQRHASVYWEDSADANGTMVASERSARRSTGELLRYSLHGTIQLGIAAYDNGSSIVFVGTFSTSQRFIPR